MQNNRELRRANARAAQKEAMKSSRRETKTRTPMMKVYSADQFDKLNEDLQTAQSNLFQAWFQETGFKPSESCVVIEQGIFGTRVYPDLLVNNTMMARLTAAEDVVRKLKALNPEGDIKAQLAELSMLVQEWEAVSVIKGEDFSAKSAIEGPLPLNPETENQTPEVSP